MRGIIDDMKKDVPETNIFSIDSGHTSAPLPSLRSFLCLRCGVSDFMEEGWSEEEGT